MSSQTPVEIVVGKFRVVLPSVDAALEFVEKAERRQAVSESPAPLPAQPEPQVSPASSPRVELRSIPDLSPPAYRKRIPTGDDALRIVLDEVRRVGQRGILTTELTTDRFDGERHGVFNALKRLARLASAFRLSPEDVVVAEDEGRSRRLRPGPSFESFRSIWSGDNESSTPSGGHEFSYHDPI